MNIILRIIASPFVFCLFIIIHAWIPIKGTFLFLRYGGEFMAYLKDDKATIAKIYEELKSQTKNQPR
jgi:hypothetical protein